MTACLIVRSEVPEGDRDGFDLWYGAEHLPDATVGLSPDAARRGWTDDDPGIQVAIYRFADAARARKAVGSSQIRTLIFEHDRAWEGRVQRARELVEVVQEL